MAYQMRTVQLWDAQAIVASAVSTSAAIPMDKTVAMAVHLTALTGTTPNVDFTYTLCNTIDGTFVAGEATFATAVAAAKIMDLAPEASRYIKIVATEAGGANTATLTGTLVIQEG